MPSTRKQSNRTGSPPPTPRTKRVKLSTPVPSTEDTPVQTEAPEAPPAAHNEPESIEQADPVETNKEKTDNEELPTSESIPEPTTDTTNPVFNVAVGNTQTEPIVPSTEDEQHRNEQKNEQKDEQPESPEKAPQGSSLLKAPKFDDELSSELSSLPSTPLPEHTPGSEPEPETVTAPVPAPASVESTAESEAELKSDSKGAPDPDPAPTESKAESKPESKSEPKSESTAKSNVDPNPNSTTETSKNASERPSSPAWPGWCTIESEPAVFNHLLHSIGVSSAQVTELYSLDTSSLLALGPCYGIIFLFRYLPSSVNHTDLPCPPGVWFANQVTSNACATLALLNIVFNVPVVLSPSLQAFKDFSADLTPPLRGLAVANNQRIRDIHNSFGKKMEMVDADIELADAARTRLAKGAWKEEETEEGGAFHFIAFVQKEGVIWELDGLRKHPRMVKDLRKDIDASSNSQSPEEKETPQKETSQPDETCDFTNWTPHILPILQSKISQHSEEELCFNLLAIIPEPPASDPLLETSNYEEIAKRRVVDHEPFVAKACEILARNMKPEELAVYLA
ncbi:hypothetical protein BZA77DRAFT_42293 [Pyronema omphalodes]|nr:hypothetical protein BZA77DRAFT_42293 [Pyronema omphalodes]